MGRAVTLHNEKLTFHFEKLGLSSEEMASMSRITAQLLQQLPGGSLDVRWDYHTFFLSVTGQIVLSLEF